MAFFAPFQLADSDGFGTQQDLLRAFDEELLRFKRLNPQFWGVRIIFVTSRHLERSVIEKGMDLSIALKKEFPWLISGFDVVGNEATGLTLSDLREDLLRFRSKCQRNSVNIPFYLHAGEGGEHDGDFIIENIREALSLESKRIGHG